MKASPVLLTVGIGFQFLSATNSIYEYDIQNNRVYEDGFFFGPMLNIGISYDLYNSNYFTIRTQMSWNKHELELIEKEYHTKEGFVYHRFNLNLIFILNEQGHS